MSSRRQEALHELNRRIDRIRELDSDLSHNLQALISGKSLLPEIQLRSVQLIADRLIVLLESLGHAARH